MNPPITSFAPLTFNLILATDSYKLCHWKMQPDGTQHVYSYGECRSGSAYPISIWHGMQPIVLKHMTGEVVTQAHIEEAKRVIKPHLGSEEMLYLEAWQIIVDEFGGKLPIEIKSAPEGTPIPTGEVCFTIVDTDPKERFAWLTNFLETLIQKVWYPTAVATRSYHIVSNIKRYVELTSDVENAWQWMLHDFGLRSTTCEEAGEIAGAAHLINSIGTDTVPALRFAEHYYGADINTLAFSVAASEHSIQNAYGHEVEDQINYVRTLMQRFPDGILSIVCDGAKGGIERFVEGVVPVIRDEIVARRELSNNPLTKVVFRPDSPRFEGDRPEEQMLWLCGVLGDIFGFDDNSKGYKVLNPCVGTILGDGLTEQDIITIYQYIVVHGWSAENVVVGQGGGLVQKLNRDTLRFAIKSSAQKQNGEWIAIQKQTADKSKRSKAGKMKLVNMSDIEGEAKLQTLTESHPLYHDHEDVLETIYRNGEVTRFYTFDEVRKNTGLW